MNKEQILEKSNKYNFVAGLDEVGAGVLCGDLVVAAVILPKNHGIIGLADSKKLSAKKRGLLSQQIKEVALEYIIVRVSPAEIDKINIYQARMSAFKKAISLLKNVDYAIIDGNKVPEGCLVDTDCIIKGDQYIECVSAASIIAKHERDSEMIKLSKQEPYSFYQLEKHKGYGTKIHIEMMNKYGVIRGFYRESYKPVKKLIDEGKFVIID